MWCASNGSAENKVERSMSILNLRFSHAGIKRLDMPKWAEDCVKNCNRAAVCDLANNFDREKGQALQKLIFLNIVESEVVDKLVSQEHLQVEGGRYNVSALILVFTVTNPNGAAP